MTALIFDTLTQILWFIFGSQTAALTTIGLTISAVFFHKSGAGRYVYPWILNRLWRLVKLLIFLCAKGAIKTFNLMVITWKPWNFGANNASSLPTTTTQHSTATLHVEPADSSSADHGWVTRTLRSMGFSAEEARTAAGTPEVAAQSTLDDKVRAALISLNPLTANR